MSTLPVNAIYSGMQQDGHWAGTPTIIIQLMEHAGAVGAPVDSLDGSYPVLEWGLEPANEVSLNKLLDRRGSSPHFAYVGATTLSNLVCSYREHHVLIIGREPSYYDIAPLVKLLLAGKRSVQVEATSFNASLDIPNVWLTLIALPSRVTPEGVSNPIVVPDEVLACIRWKADLDRAELLYGRRHRAVWLRPSPLADEGIHRQCISAATRHVGWRVIPQPRSITRTG